MEEKGNKKGRHSDNKKHKGGGMGMRGVSRPMAEKQMKKHHQQMKEGKQQEKHKENHHGDGKQHDGHMMGKEQRMEMLHMHHIQTLWIYWMLIILGVWLVLSPLTFSYAKGVVDPGGGRDVWLSLSQRISFMAWSD